MSGRTLQRLVAPPTVEVGAIVRLRRTRHLWLVTSVDEDGIATCFSPRGTQLYAVERLEPLLSPAEEEG